MKNKSALRFTLIVIVLFVAAFMYVWYSRSARSTSQPSASLIEVISRVSAIGGSMASAGWSTYQLKNTGLTLSYPQGLLLQETPNGVNIIADTAENRAYIKEPSGNEGTRPGMFIKITSPNQTLEEYARQTFPDLEHASATLFGENVIVFTGQGMDRWDMILFTHDSKLYEVSIQYGSPNDEARTNFYKILSSFIWKN